MKEQPNLKYINQLSGGDTVFEKKLLSIIKAEFPIEYNIYLDNINSKNFKLAANNVHKLKHKISILGLEKSYGIASVYEICLNDDNDDSLKEEFNEIMQVITNYLNNL